MPYTTPCVRCGKPRIVAKEWKETLNGTTITHVQTVCPDPECQKIVDKELQKKKEKFEALQEESQKRRMGKRAEQQREKHPADAA